MSENAEASREIYGVHPPYQQGVFVHSMANFSSIFEKLLADLNPGAYCEIGVEGQIMTHNIIAMARPHNAKIYGIDPMIACQPDYANYVLIRQPSHAGLTEIPSCDVYFVDGDHNYFTVKGELDRIKKIPASSPNFPIIFLHDVGWPTDRRDSYYLPSHVPDVSRHSHDSGLGVDPTIPGLSEFGLAAGDTGYVFANDRGGQKNGVLTALEAFVLENPDWNYLTIPGVFGLGILYRPQENDVLVERVCELKKAVAWLGEEIAILEYNRLHLGCESYRSHHDFSRTIEELSALKLTNAAMEGEFQKAADELMTEKSKNLALDEAFKTAEKESSALKSTNIALNETLAKAVNEASVLRSQGSALQSELINLHRTKEELGVRIEKLNEEYTFLAKSWSLRIGRVITFPVRYVWSLFK